MCKSTLNDEIAMNFCTDIQDPQSKAVIMSSPTIFRYVVA